MPTALGLIQNILRGVVIENRRTVRRASGSLGRLQQLEYRQLLSAKRSYETIHAAAQGARVEHDRRDHRLQVDGLPLSTDSVSGATGPQSAAPLNLAQTFQLNSLPSATKTIYLDFNGHTTSGTWWNSAYNGGAAFTTPAFSVDSNSAFSDAELERIQLIWQRVAEDFAPFNVNVTTQDPGTAAIVKSGSGDTAWGVRVVIGGSYSDWFEQSAGGVAYLNTFGSSTDMGVFVFSNNLANSEKYVAEAISHEAGHALGLSHDGQGSTSYYQGHGSGATGWAPIMGVGYYRELTQWSKGEYPNSTTTQDDLAIIASSTNGFGYRADDYGSTRTTASVLATTAAGAAKTVNQAGVIERGTDQDWFSFSTTGGLVALNVNGAPRGPNLDVAASIYDASGTLVLTSNPLDNISASISTTLPAGTYSIMIDGVGTRGLSDGYSDYGSLGQYVITGSIPDDAGLPPQTPVVQIMDNGEVGYSTTGNWQRYESAGRDGDWDYALKSTGTGTATWTFNNLTPGQYRVSTTWGAHPAFASNAQYSIRAVSGGVVLGSSLINQQLAPNDLSDQGSAWEDLKTVTITGSTLIVELTNAGSDQYVIADAIRIERIGSLASGPEITVLDQGTDIASGTGTVDFGSAALGQPIFKTFTVVNTGSSDLILQPAVAPAGFTITTNFTSNPIPSGGTASLVVRLDATSLGSVSGNLSFATNDTDENPFQFTVSGNVGNFVQIIDNGDPGYSTSGSWQRYGSAGRDGDWDYALKSTGTGTATWTFNNLTPGQYRVSTTWGAHPAFASNAEYSIRAASGGVVLGSSLINQQLAPNDLTDQGSAWEDLRTVTITGSTLIVELTNAGSDLYVIADAIRIERIGE